MEPQCLDDLVGAHHPVRMVMAVVEKLDVALLRADQGARRAGGAGRDRSAIAGGVVAVCLDPGHRLGAGAGAAVRGERAVPLAVRRGDGEPSPAVGFPHRSRGRAGRAVHAGDRVAGGQEVVRVSRISQDGVRVRVGAGGGQFSAGRAAAGVAGASPAARGGVAPAGGLAGKSALATARQRAARKRAAEAAAAVGAGDRAVAGAEAEAGGSGEEGGQGQVRPEDPGAAAAGEHHRCGSAGDEDAQRRVQPGGRTCSWRPIPRAARSWAWR